MAEPVTVKFSISSTLTDAHHAQERVMRAVEEAGFTPTSGFAIRLALDEALSNAVKHGNKLDPAKHVDVEYTVNDQGIVIRIRDEGAGFEPSDVPDPTLDENLERPHGRGIMLMRAYMTEVGYEEQGNCVMLVKTRDCPLPHR
jgi:serine/threonine-protein kinase RsbW